MNSLKITLGLIATILLSSCGSSVESDAKKLADLQCKSMKMAEKIQSGEMDVSNATESMSFAIEASELAEKLEGKYTTGEDQREFQKAVLKAMKDCK